MKKNMGSVDRTIRIVLAIAVALLVYYEVVQGVLAYILIAVAAVFILTSLANFCPLYTIFGWNTCKIKDKK
tara:strand:- start:9371 stop:9583 length:213 start_codon:yes stop_codon:yes gene_type:complete